MLNTKNKDSSYSLKEDTVAIVKDKKHTTTRPTLRARLKFMITALI